MKSVAELAKPKLVGAQPHQSVPTENAVEITPQAVAVMDKLFDRLTVICPAWHKSLPSDAAVANFKTLWLEEIINANIRNWKLLARGLEHCKQAKNPFLPSVGQFIEWCLAEDYQALGLPDEAELLRRLRVFQGCGMENLHKFKFRSDAEYWLITDLYSRCRTGEWREEKLVEETKKALVKMAKRIKQGEQIPAMAITLPAKVERVDPVKSQQWIAKIKADLGVRQ